MNGPLEELQFTDEEIDCAVRALMAGTNDACQVPPNAATLVRAVLRAVRAVPARCLNGGLAGNPASPGDRVQGTGLGGVLLRGTVVWSYPVTTAVRTPGNGVEYIWTNTIRSWDPSTDELAQQLGVGSVMMNVNVPLGHFVVFDPALVADDDGMAVEDGR